MPATAEAIQTKPRITRLFNTSPILRATGRTELAITAGTTVAIDGKTHIFETDTPVAFDKAPVAGLDYAVRIDGISGKPFAIEAASKELEEQGVIAGFHFAPGGNATARAGGDDRPAINPLSIWDIDFRPACADPRGMTLVTMDDGVEFWADIYLLNTEHKTLGTSRFGAKIADGRSLDRLDYQAAVDIYDSHGKRLMTYEEFHSAAWGVTEKTSAAKDPDIAGLDAARTSQFGLMQATGNLWVWGTDGDPDYQRPSVFGGSWLSGDNAGSRFALLVLWPGASSGYLSARGACGHLSPA